MAQPRDKKSVRPGALCSGSRLRVNARDTVRRDRAGNAVATCPACHLPVFVDAGHFAAHLRPAFEQQPGFLAFWPWWARLALGLVVAVVVGRLLTWLAGAYL